MTALSAYMELHKLVMVPSLDRLESVWLSPWVCSPASQVPRRISHPRAKWILQLSLEGLVEWLRSTNKWTLQFDGASKGNPGVAGGGGILSNLEGIIEFRYAWGLGWKTNNQAEVYGLFLGLTLAQKKGIKIIQALRDSMIIIRHMIYATRDKNTTLNQIIKRYHGLLPSFDLVSFYHILKINNQEADKQANHACQLREERCILNEVKSMTKIP